MMAPRQSFALRLSLLTSIILTFVFGLTGYLLSTSVSRGATQTVEREVITSFSAYTALWTEHTQNLQKVSSVISRMTDVRAAFLTNDRATIQDTAGELWSRIASGNALLAVADGHGKVIASLGNGSPFRVDQTLDFASAFASFPNQQMGFLQRAGRLFQLVVTPVYVDTAVGRQGLLNVLVTGFELDYPFLRSLKSASGGSDLIFSFGGQARASTLAEKADMLPLGNACSNSKSEDPRRVAIGSAEYLVLSRFLPALAQEQSGELCIVRSLAESQAAVTQLQHRTLALWLAGLLSAIVSLYIAVGRMLRPVKALDCATAEISKGNYHVRVEQQGDDELGRLAQSFNLMSQSLERARAELIRHERLESVARLATFVVHDLRNPLASIYAGAEMLVDHNLPDKQVRRLARNMYTASRGVLEILTNLLAAARPQNPEPEVCLLHDLVVSAWNGLAEARQRCDIRLDLRFDNGIELLVDRGPIERVFHNLLENAIEAIEAVKSSGCIQVSAAVTENAVQIDIQDDGRGIDPELRPILFQPFATKGRVGGLGLGLALSRQTVLAHGGDLIADFKTVQGSHFILRLPLHASLASQSAEILSDA